MKLFGETMQAIFNQAGCPVILTTGTGISGEEIERDLKESDDKVIVYMSILQDHNGTLSMSSNGEIIEGDITLNVHAHGDNADIKVVKEAKKRVALGFTNEAGLFGPHCNAPFKVGGFEFLRWEPLGKEFDETATLDGNHFKKNQIIQFEMIRS